jgi:ubiquinone/menaquinone biosynthesis C-methylase UbiE
MINKKHEIGQLFDRAAKTYDSIGPSFFAHFGSKMVSFAEINSGAQVLDVACGRGAILFPAAKAVGEHGHVVGIDLSESMVNETSKEIIKRSLMNATVLKMDAENLDFPDASFDLVLAGFCIFFFTDPNQAFQEMHRVLKPKGKIVLSTWIKTEDRRKWIGELTKSHLSSEAQIQEAFRLLPKGFDSPAEIEKSVALAGFVDTNFQEEKKEFFYTDEEQWWRAQGSHGIRSVLEYIEKVNGPDGLSRFKADALKRLQSLRKPEGFGQTMEALFAKATKAQNN